MRRVLVGLAALSLLGVGLFYPAEAGRVTGPAEGLTGGTATIVVGQDPTTLTATWTTTLSGQVAAGGRFYSGTASGTRSQSYPGLFYVAFAGTSGTGSITAGCQGTNQPDLSSYTGGVGPPAPPAGVLDLQCDVSIDGAPSVAIELFIATAPSGVNTFSGAYAGAPDDASASTLPTVPVVSFGFSHASVFIGPATNGFDFTLTGQLTLGDQAFHGTASGSAGLSSGTSVNGVGLLAVPPFALSGTSPSGSLSATCSGTFVQGLLSVLGCDGYAGGGASGHATLVSVYRETGHETHFGDKWTYDGVFAGL